MFFKHLITLATIALLSMSGAGKLDVRLQTQQAQTADQVQSPATLGKDQADNDQDKETQDKADGDSLQAGNEATPDLTDSADLTDTTDVTDTAGITASTDMTAEERLKTESADTEQQDGQEIGKAQEEAQNSSDANAEGDRGQATQDTLPASKPAITPDVAQKTAEAHLKSGVASKVELDEENGKLVYSVQIGNTDVKVDAMTGAVLYTDKAED